jgi:type IV secretion system protein VirB10
MNDAFPFEASTDPRRKLTPKVLDLANSNGYPIVASQFVRRDRAGLMLGGSLALLLGAATLFAMSNNRTSIAKIVPPPSPAAPIQTLPAPVTAPVVQNLPPAPAVVPAPLVQPPLPTPVPNPQIALNIAADRGRAPTLIFDNSPGERPVVQAAAATPAPATAKATPQGLSVEESFAQRVGGEGDTASATRMANPGMTVAQGTLMSAVLETAIDSDLPGYVRAIISRDVKSYDGSRVLIPRSSHVIGQYKSELAVGQTRAYVLWTRLLTPDGVSIALGSPATDSAGRNGLSGKVSSHFGKRFGSAILLSVIGAAGQAVGGGGGAVIVAGPQAAASSSAQRDINIPPTVRVSQGQPIRIFTARDLDFSTVTP